MKRKRRPPRARRTTRRYSPYEWGFKATVANYVARGMIGLAALAAFLALAIALTGWTT